MLKLRCSINYPDSVGAAPANNVITNNYIHDNQTNSGVILRGASNTLVQGNAIDGTYNGTRNSSTDGGLEIERTTGTTFIDNTVTNTASGLFLYGTTAGATIEHNRFVNVGENYIFSGATVTLDGGADVGGNFWSNATAGTAFTNFLYDTAGHRGGGYADHFPAADESLGEPYAVTVTNPLAGTIVANGSPRAIAWTSTGAAAVDIYYSSTETGDTLVAKDQPDNGVYTGTVPALPAGTDYVVKVVPLDSSGVAHGDAGVSGTFIASGTSSLTLLSPGGTDTQSPGGTVVVAWDAATANTTVNVQLQEDGGAWKTVASAITDDHTTITLPTSAASVGRIRVVNTHTGVTDTQDGTFRITGTPAIAAIPATVSAGTVQTISWTSPATAVAATVQFFDGTAWEAIATTTPDVGSVAWLVPAVATTGSSIRIAYFDASGDPVGTATSNTFNLLAPIIASTPTSTPTPTPTTPTTTPTPTPTSTTVAASQGATLVVDLSSSFDAASIAGKLAKVKVQFTNAAGAAISAGTVKVAGGKVSLPTSKLHTAGTYTVTVTNSAGATTTRTLTLAASAASKIVFTAVPASLDGTSAVVAHLVDKYGNLTTLSDGVAMTLKLTKSKFGKTAVLTGNTTATVSGGIATFANLSISGATLTTGKAQFTATAGKLKSAASAAFGIA